MMNMPEVSKCDMSECSYNEGNQCHALAITIGDQTNPMCDTFLKGSTHGGDPSSTAKVGACKVSVCKFNKSLECSASSVEVGHRGQDAYCMTFET